MNITERLQYIVDQLFGGNKAAFARAIDIAPTSISNYLGKERASKPSSDILEKIVNSVKQVNAYWLLTGKGEAFEINAKNSTIENNSTKCENESSYIECIRNLTEANLLNAEANNRNSKSLEFLIQSINKK